MGRDRSQELWVERYDGTGSTDVPRAVTVTPDRGAVIVTGNSWGDGSGSDYATIAYDAVNGDQRGVARHDGSGERFGHRVGRDGHS